jgi:hypothetical protein
VLHSICPPGLLCLGELAHAAEEEIDALPDDVRVEVREDVSITCTA